MRGLLICVGLLALPLLGDGVSGESEKKARAAWEWTSEERLAARFNPLARRASLHGDQTPELLMPIELFASLMNGIEGDMPFRTAYRATLRDQILRFGFDDEEFWRDLELAISSHVTVMKRQEAFVKKPFERGESGARAEVLAEAERANRRMCASRVDALAKAREHFGSADFDRFLYTVVAPGLTITPEASVTAEHLRFVAGGCQ